jgi:hypothetical protein
MRFFVLLFLPALAVAKDLNRDPVLFHAGARPALEEDIAAHTVPADAWDKYIFGKTNFDLPPYRQGLYGAEAVAGTSLYVLYDFLGAENPWLMMIHLKPECLRGDSLFDEDFSVAKDPAKGGRFSRWYLAHREKYRALETDCLADAGDYGSWETGAPYNVNGADAETQRLTKLCTPVLDDFLRANDVKVARDGVNDDSWYVRDRACIADIRGTPDELFDRILAGQVGDPEEDFVKNFFGDPVTSGAFFAGSTYLFLFAASETSHLDARAFPRLDAIEKELTDWIGKDKRDDSKLSFSRNDDNPKILRVAVRALRTAIQQNKTAELQGKLRAWLARARAELSKTCDGKHGVKPERRAACDRVSDQAAGALLRLLRGR